MAYFGFLLLLCLLRSIAQSDSSELHKYELSEKQTKILFHRNLNAVPEFHTVSIETFFKYRKRRYAENDFRLVRFELKGQKYSLKLFSRIRSVISNTRPVWAISSILKQRSNYTYKLINQKDTNFNGIFFEDKDFMATLLAHDDEQQHIVYDGIFGLGTEIHVIRSVSEKWRSLIKSTHVDRKLSSEKNEYIVYKTQNHDKKIRSSFLTAEDSDASKRLEIPLSVLHVKIVPVVDYELFKLLKENIRETLRYVATFWNAVDLRFSKMDASNIEINITGVVIATDDGALSFVNLTRYDTDFKKVYPYEFLEEARTYFYENFIKHTGFTNYDAIFVMTALNTKPVAGMSYVGRICNRLYSTAFIQDDASFLGLHSAVHELGHLLNFVHDGSDNAEDCKPYPNKDESTVMAPFISTAKSIVWSQCSKTSLLQFIQTKAAKCLRETYRIK